MPSREQSFKFFGVVKEALTVTSGPKQQRAPLKGSTTGATITVLY